LLFVGAVCSLAMSCIRKLYTIRALLTIDLFSRNVKSRQGIREPLIN
jgi:hypothetical protein